MAHNNPVAKENNTDYREIKFYERICDKTNIYHGTSDTHYMGLLYSKQSPPLPDLRHRTATWPVSNYSLVAQVDTFRCHYHIDDLLMY